MNSSNYNLRPTLQRTIDKGSVSTPPQSLSLVRVLHQARNLLHHSQSAVINTVTQFHFAAVQDHVLVVVCAYKRKQYVFKMLLVSRPGQ